MIKTQRGHRRAAAGKGPDEGHLGARQTRDIENQRRIRAIRRDAMMIREVGQRGPSRLNRRGSHQAAQAVPAAKTKGTSNTKNTPTSSERAMISGLREGEETTMGPKL